MLEAREGRVQKARDAMAAAKLRGAEQANQLRGKEPLLEVGDLVMIYTKDRQARLKGDKKERRSAKFLARWDGPYPITKVFAEQSQYRL
jgi:hypothetical protein